MSTPFRHAARGAPGGAAATARRAAGCVAWLLGAGAAAPVAAHPHGSLDCAARVSMGPAGPTAIALTLTLDAASSASLQPRLQADDSGRPPADRQARLFADVLSGLMRQSGWMLTLQPLGADDQAGPALPLADPEPATWRRNAQGRLEVSVQLVPEAAAEAPASLPPARYRLRCQDPVWYWATGFADAGQFTVDPPCRAQLDTMGSLADQARALQAAAQRAGVVGADVAAPGLLAAPAQRAPGGDLHCPVR